MPPASVAQGMSSYPDTGYGVSLLLGTDYERRKSKLLQELQQDYKQFVAKKKESNLSEPHPQPLGLSLPLHDRTLVQEKLRVERKKEYNLFLEKQARNRRLRTDVPPVSKEPGNIQASNAAHTPSVSPPPVRDTLMNDPPPWKRPASRQDAATLTEALDDGERTKSRVQGYQGRRRWRIIRPKELPSSEEEVNSDREEELEFQHRRRHVRYTPEPEYREREARERRATRAARAQHSKEEKAPGGYDQNNNSLTKESDLQMPDRMRTPARSRPATRQEKAELATGLMIGATEEQAASQQRKEQYKQELLKQIAEQQRNKIREKKLELRVAATGAKDHEKESDRFNQYDTVNQPDQQDASPKPGKGREVPAKEPKDKPRDGNTTEDAKWNIPLEKPIVDSNTGRPVRWIALPVSGTGAAQQVPSLNCYSEGYNRNLSDVTGEVAWQRVAAVPPAPPPVAYHNMTPYDAAYYHYGTRNPLDFNLPYWQQLGSFQSPSHPPPPQRPSGYTEPPDHQRASQQKVGEALEEKPEQRRNSSLSYREALRQQIKEREEHKTREKEEKEREAKVPAYNPWGKSGGGAPIKDQNGNLVSDLNQMHRTNEESYRNPELRNHGHKQRVMMGDVPSLLPGLDKETYKEELTKQVEEKKRIKEEEKEQMRLTMAEEEKRLEDQRARMRKQYEEDQRKEEIKRRGLKDLSRITEPKTQHRMDGKEGRQEKDVEKTPESIRDREEKQEVWSYKIKEREECSRREKEEGSYNAKKEVELPAYSSPGCEDGAPLTHHLPGCNKKTFKEELLEQIEEKKREKKEEEEARRLLMEQDEKRLVDQQARMRREHEEMQRKKKERLQSPPIPTLQKRQIKPVASRSSSVMRQLSSKTRGPSPPIPTLQKKQTNAIASRSSSVMSQLSSKTELSVSTPSYREAPANAQDRQQGVLRELSTLRRYLRKMQRQQKLQLGWTNSQDSDYLSPSRPRGHPRGIAFNRSHQQGVQSSISSPSSGAAHANSQNIRDFNQLKYRDTASREEVRHMYPDPPTDAQSLDIQQQALLREQQRKIRLMKKDEEHDFLDQELNRYHPENKPGHHSHRDSMLPSQSAFINAYGDRGSEGQRQPQPSAENRERTTARRRHDYDEVAESMDQRDCLPFLNPGSEVKPNNQPHVQRQKTADHTTRSEGLSGDEADVLSLRSALERPVSVDTVATEPWLRPGTSDAVKQSGRRERPNSRVDTPPWLTHRVT